MIRSKTGCYSALERLFRPQNGHCKSFQVASGAAPILFPGYDQESL